METPPTSKSKLSCRRIRSQDPAEEFEFTAAPSTSAAITTPINKTFYDNEDSPIFFPATQEMVQEIDVSWDWSSPSDKIERKRKIPRKIIQTSTKPIEHSIIRHPSTMAQNKNFDKLREELLALQRELTVPDKEAYLSLSPLEEKKFKEDDEYLKNLEAEKQHEENFPVSSDELFNDSIDEQLVLVTQQVEHNLVETSSKTDTFVQQTVFDNTEIDDIIKKYTTDKTVEDFNIPKKLEQTKGLLARTVSEEFSNVNANKKCDSKFQFPRTKSLEMESPKHQQGCQLPKHLQEKIEKNRQEALAKRALTLQNASKNNKIQTERSKCQKNIPSSTIESNNDTNGSLPQDLLEKIEMNRQKALAKMASKTLPQNTNSINRMETNKTDLVASTNQPPETLPKEVLDRIERKRQEALAKRKLAEQQKCTNRNVIQTDSGRLEFHRTKSFEIDASIQRKESVFVKDTIMKQVMTGATIASVASMKCSPEEIEKKRAEALKKLNESKKKAQIEKNRQEAIKKLQMNRMKKAGLVKSTLCERLD